MLSDLRIKAKGKEGKIDESLRILRVGYSGRKRQKKVEGVEKKLK